MVNGGTHHPFQMEYPSSGAYYVLEVVAHGQEDPGEDLNVDVVGRGDDEEVGVMSVVHEDDTAEEEDWDWD